MKIKRTAGALICLVSVAISAHADYHTVLMGVRLHLSTTTFQDRVSISSKAVNGFTDQTSAENPGMVHLASSIVDGYIARISADPPISISSTGLTGKGDYVLFYSASELVRIQYPHPTLANTETIQGTFIPRKIIQSAEALKLPFEGDAGMGEPTFVPSWQAKLMSTKPPVYSCAPPTEQGNCFFISYNEKIGENELSPLCKKPEIDMAAFAPLAKNPSVFGFCYPAD